jgi:hypothetical protein
MLRPMRRTRLLSSAATGAGAAALVIAWASACGSRTGLLADEGAIANDDSGTLPDGAPKKDVVSERSLDALPLIDATPLPDVVRNDCPDAAATLIYVITTQNGLFSFNPPTGAFTRIGTIVCPAPAGSQPFSMAVDRKGVAYIVFDATTGAGKGALYRVSTATAACIGTAFVPNQLGFTTFGMGFASNVNGPDETLFIASDSITSTTMPPTLGTIDVTTFKASRVAAFAPAIENAELTGTGDGRLFAFYRKTSNGTGSAIGQIDKQTARVIAETPLPTVDQQNHWAFGFWGGDFYTFTGAQGAGTTVTRLRPADASVTVVGSMPEDIVGAGVSTCAPEN